MEENKKSNIYKIIMLVVLTIFITFIVTSLIFYQYFSSNGKLLLVTSNSNSGIEEKLDRYKSIIDEYYLGEVNEEDLTEGAIKGYIEGLGDPYTEYISKENMEDYLADTMGNFVGIGIYMINDPTSGKIMVLSPIKGSPAEKAGILPGDLIISIDGTEYSGEESSIAASKIKGEEGTTVKLEILRGTQNMSFEIKRENIIVNPVEGKVLENNIGYISFTSFDEKTAEEFKNKFEELQKSNIKSLIIDLRNNGGGLVDQALQIADYIVPKDSVLLYEVDKNNN